MIEETTYSEIPETMEAAGTEGSDLEMEEEYLEDSFEEETVTDGCPIDTRTIEVTIDPLAIPDDTQDEGEPVGIEIRETERPRHHLCVKCKKTFGTQDAYKEHIARAHASPRLCGTCGFSFLNELGLRLHTMRKHPGTLAEQFEKRAVWCVECKAHFADAAQYALHARTCRPCGHSPHPGVCPTCDSPAEVCRQHRPAIHCELCGESMENNRVYQQHFQSVHPNENGTLRPRPPPTCGRCGKQIHVAPGRRHVCRVEEPAHACDTCGLRCPSVDELTSHVATHTRKRSHACDECERAFNSVQNLKRHAERAHGAAKRRRRASDATFQPAFVPRIEDVRTVTVEAGAEPSERAADALVGAAGTLVGAAGSASSVEVKMADGNVRDLPGETPLETVSKTDPDE